MELEEVGEHTCAARVRGGGWVGVALHACTHACGGAKWQCGVGDGVCGVWGVGGVKEALHERAQGVLRALREWDQRVERVELNRKRWEGWQARAKGPDWNTSTQHKRAE